MLRSTKFLFLTSVKIAIFCDFLGPIVQPFIAPFSSDMPIYIFFYSPSDFEKFRRNK